MHNHRAVRLLTRSFIGCCWIIAGCKSAPPEPTLTLPPASATGANTLGFVINGRTWTNYGPICPGTGFGTAPCTDNQLLVQCQSFHGVRSLSLMAILSTDKHFEYFNLSVDSVRGPGIYKSGPLAANKLFIPNQVVFTDNKAADPTKQLYHSIAPNITRITLTRVDTVQHIIAGTFEGRLDVINHPENSASITQGRFDVTYQL